MLFPFNKQQNNRICAECGETIIFPQNAIEIDGKWFCTVECVNFHAFRTEVLRNQLVAAGFVYSGVKLV